VLPLLSQEEMAKVAVIEAEEAEVVKVEEALAEALMRMTTLRWSPIRSNSESGETLGVQTVIWPLERSPPTHAADEEERNEVIQDMTTVEFVFCLKDSQIKVKDY